MNVDSLSLDLVPVCRTCGITETRTAQTESDVKRPNVSRALIWRQWQSVTCSAVRVPVHTTCDNQSFPILPRYSTCHRQMVYCASDHWAARVIKIMTLTRQRRVAHCRGHRDVPVCHYFFFHHGLNIIARVLVRTHKKNRNIDGRSNARMRPPAGKAREAHGATKPVYHGRPVKISAWSKSATFANDARCAGELSQRSAVLKRATLTLCSRAHGRAAAQRWLALGSWSSRCRWRPFASKRDTNTPMTTNHRKTFLHVRLSSHKSWADFQAKMNDWDRPTRAMPMGRLKLKKKRKRKLGPTDRQYRP